MTTQPALTLRMPRGLWDDFAATVYQQDRQFLLDVARDLGLPPREVLDRCLGRLGPTSVPCLWTPARAEPPDACPYWTCCGDSLWRRCPRTRLSDSLPCALHERSTGGTKHQSDPDLQAMPWLIPLRDGENLVWVDPAGVEPPRTEDGRPLADLRYRRILVQGDHVWVRQRISETSV
jgi:hypothetical protein